METQPISDGIHSRTSSHSSRSSLSPGPSSPLASEQEQQDEFSVDLSTPSHAFLSEETASPATTSASHAPEAPAFAATPSEDSTATPKPRQRKKKAQPVKLIRPPGPLPALPNSTPLPDLEDFHLLPEQLKNPLFVAIAKILIVYGNAWQSATDLVDGIRHFNLANLGGRTPKGTVQGAISTGLALASALQTFEPIEKQRMNSTTYYRMSALALEPPLPGDSDSDATESDSQTGVSRKDGSEGGARERSKSRPKSKSGNTNVRRKQNQSSAGDDPSKKKKKRTTEGWSSDTMSSDSSDDEDGLGHSKSGNNSLSKSKRARTSSPSSSSKTKPPVKAEPIPNGLKKLPKGYVYDTEINQSALMHLSINPSQTGEYMQHLKDKNSLENDFPDRRGDYGLDLTQEPSMFAIEQQIGYTYPRLRTSGRERLPKTDCEDGYAIADLKFSNGFLGRLFCITDGHGGRACSSFVIATIPGAMQVILGKYKPTDLSRTEVQELVKSQITEALRLIDKEYLDYKKQQYLLYKAKKIPNDPGSDGTTLIVNIFIDKWIINVNLGDSRSMLSSRDNIGRWNVDFFSEDHTPSLERLAQKIYANGGEFVTHDDKIIKFDPAFKNDKKHRQSLKEARIRVRDAATNLYGIPYRTRNGQCASVNLGACIGDVLYKLDAQNPVLSCIPDITFIDVTSIQQGFLLMASDGLWDYVQRGGKVQEQNTAVCQFVGDKLDRGWNHQRIVCTLADREGMSGLYSDSIQEYDDFTAILVTINSQQLLRQQERRQADEDRLIAIQKQKIHEQQLLILQEQQLKKEQEEAQQRERLEDEVAMQEDMAQERLEEEEPVEPADEMMEVDETDPGPVDDSGTLNGPISSQDPADPLHSAPEPEPESTED